MTVSVSPWLSPAVALLAPLSARQKVYTVCGVLFAAQLPLLLQAWQNGQTEAVGYSALGLLLAGYLARALARSWQQECAAMTTTLQHLLDHDTTHRSGLAKRDETGRLAAWVDLTVRNWSEFFADLDRAATELHHAAGEAEEMADHLQAALEQQRDLTFSSSATLDELSTSLAATTCHMQQVAAAAEHNLRAAEQGAQKTQQVAHDIEAATRQVQAAAQDIARLHQRAQQIESVLKLIRSIAGQINLLALNATIEAARAGEAGRGFSVVAEEVRQLSVRTNDATRDISQEIAQVQKDVASVLLRIETCTRQTQASAADARANVDLLSRMQEQARRTSELADQIAGAIAEQSLASTALASHVESGTSLAERNAVCIRENAELARYLGTLALQLQGRMRRR